MTKPLLTLILVLSGLLALTGWQAKVQYSKASALRTEITTISQARDDAVKALNQAVEREKSDRQLLVARQAQIASQARKLKDVQNRLSAALERNKAWSDADVPPDIIGGLAGPSGALPDGLPVGTEGQDCEGTPSSCPVTGVPSTVP